MPNIIITAVATKNYHKLDYGDYSTVTGIDYRFFWSEDIFFVDVDGHVAVTMKNGDVWQLSFDGSDGTFQVDSVIGAIPSDNDDLADSLANLKG